MEMVNLCPRTRRQINIFHSEILSLQPIPCMIFICWQKVYIISKMTGPFNTVSLSISVKICDSETKQNCTKMGSF